MVLRAEACEAIVQQLHVSLGSFRRQCGVCVGVAQTLDINPRQGLVGDSVGLAGFAKNGVNAGAGLDGIQQ